MIFVYLSSGLVVVQVHQRATSLPRFACIEKLRRKLHSELPVGRAATPLEALRRVLASQLPVVTAATRKSARAARFCYDVGYRC